MTMNATTRGASRARTSIFYDPAAAYIAANVFDRPTLVISRDRVGAQYDALKSGLGDAHIQTSAAIGSERNTMH